MKIKYKALTSKSNHVPLKGVPDAIDNAIFVDDQWPFIVDPTGQAARFMQYQNGAFLMATRADLVQPENLRSRLVSCLENGRNLILSFGNHDAVVDGFFQEGFFPKVYLRTVALNAELEFVFFMWHDCTVGTVGAPKDFRGRGVCKPATSGPR